MKTHGRLHEVVADLHWYALLTPPQKEFVAQEILKRQGIVAATFVPCEKLWRKKTRYSRDKDLMTISLMPRLVFAGFKPSFEVPWWYILNLSIITGPISITDSLTGLKKPVKINGVPEMISRFKFGLVRPDAERHMRTHKEYKAGDTVTISDPRFQDRLVTVDAIKDGHAYFRLELFNGTHELRLPLDRLEAA